MNPFQLDRADTYLKTEWQGSRSPWPAKPPGPFVTISRQAGSGGSSLARILARKLNGETPVDTVWTVFEGNLVSRMLRANQLPTRCARFIPEDHVPELNAWLGEVVGLHPNLLQMVEKTNETTRQLATTGHAIFVGRGANFATADIENGVHVRLVAPVAHRAQYLAQLYNISEAEAFVLNAKCDLARRRYVKATFNAQLDDPTAYDLVINTAHVSLANAAELIARRVRSLTPTPA